MLTEFCDHRFSPLVEGHLPMLLAKLSWILLYAKGCSVIYIGATREPILLCPSHFTRISQTTEPSQAFRMTSSRKLLCSSMLDLGFLIGVNVFQSDTREECSKREATCERIYSGVFGGSICSCDFGS